MKNHEYSLDKSSKKYVCPKCKKKRFVLYLDNGGKGKLLHSSVGKCDRDSCAHHYTPKRYYTDNRISFDALPKPKPKPAELPKPKPPPSFIDRELMKRSLGNYETNVLIRWLSPIVGKDAAIEAAKRYNVGTSPRNGNSPIFWQVDLQGDVRTGKIMQYDRNGNRRRDIPKWEAMKWVHAELKKIGKIKEFNLSQCFYGEHLLADSSKPVAICEAPKTMIIASIYMPEFIWIACDNSNGLGGEKSDTFSEKCNVLKGRDVVLFPDAGKYEFWCKKAEQLSEICNVTVSSLIEQYATEQEKIEGFDIADFLIRFSPQQFHSQKATETPIVMAENSAVTNKTVASMTAKNPALLKLIQTFDCEITDAIVTNPNPRLLTPNELRELAARIPEHNSFTEAELCKMLNIETHNVNEMTTNKLLIYINLTGKFCRHDTTPF